MSLIEDERTKEQHANVQRYIDEDRKAGFQEGAEAMREACARTVCIQCRKGTTPVENIGAGGTDLFVHVWSKREGDITECDAKAIRALKIEDVLK